MEGKSTRLQKIKNIFSRNIYLIVQQLETKLPQPFKRAVRFSNRLTIFSYLKIRNFAMSTRHCACLHFTAVRRIVLSPIAEICLLQLRWNYFKIWHNTLSWLFWPFRGFFQWFLKCQPLFDDLDDLHRNACPIFYSW